MSGEKQKSEEEYKKPPKTTGRKKAWSGDGVVKEAETEISLAELRKKDIKQRLKWRPWVAFPLLGLLFIQNGYLPYVLAHAQAWHLGDVAIGSIVAATLVETAAIVHTIVKFLFSDIDYK